MLLARRRFRKTRARVIQLQTAARRWIHQLAYEKFRWAVVALQARMRGRAVRWWGFKGQTLSKVLLSRWHTHLHVRRLKQLQTSARKLQRWFRVSRDLHALQSRARALVFLRGVLRRAISRRNIRRF